MQKYLNKIAESQGIIPSLSDLTETYARNDQEVYVVDLDYVKLNIYHQNPVDIMSFDDSVFFYVLYYCAEVLVLRHNLVFIIIIIIIAYTLCRTYHLCMRSGLNQITSAGARLRQPGKIS